MKQRLIDDTCHRFYHAGILLSLLIFISLSIFLLHICSKTTFASSIQLTNRLYTVSSVSPTPPLQTTVPTPTMISTTSTNTSSQNSQIQTENGVASLTIEVAGAFVAVVVLILTITAIIAGILGLREFNAIKASRVKLSEEVNKVEGEIEAFKIRLQNFSEDFEKQSQMFIEASFQFTQGKVMYKEGDDEQAIAYYLEALKLLPNNPQILERLGRAYSNLDGPKNRELAIHYLNEALKIDEKNEAALRGLGLCYRDVDPETAYSYFYKCSGFEALDFLGLLYRDQRRFEDAMEAHQKALEVHKKTFGGNTGARPETLFYLGLLHAHKGDMINAKKMAAAANKAIDDPEHLFRLRLVWRILIRACYFIIFDNRREALYYLRKLAPYITTKRIYDGVYDHLNVLLDATDHKEWKHQFLETVKLTRLQRM